MDSSQSFIRPSQRIASFKPYFYASLSERIAELKAKNVDVIRIDMGSPDLPPADFIIDALEKNARRADVHGYAQMGGSPAFKKAVALLVVGTFKLLMKSNINVSAIFPVFVIKVILNG